MTKISEALRDEHLELMPHIEFLREGADSEYDSSLEDLRRAVNRAGEFLAEHLVPHAEAEEEVLYPLLDGLMGAPGATMPMSLEHAEIGRLAQELSTLKVRLGDKITTPSQARGLRRDFSRIMYSLHAIIRVHMATEEQLYLPLLDSRLSEEEGQEVYRKMEEAAARMKAKTAAA
jgi:hemerythrin-like domain-containing protein